MTALFTKNQKLQNSPKFKTTKELLESLRNEKEVYQKEYFILEKEFEGIQNRILEIRNHQKHHKEKIYAIDRQIKKYNQPKATPPTYNYTSFYFFVGLLITIFFIAVYFLVTDFM